MLGHWHVPLYRGRSHNRPAGGPLRALTRHPPSHGPQRRTSSRDAPADGAQGRRSAGWPRSTRASLAARAARATAPDPVSAPGTRRHRYREGSCALWRAGSFALSKPARIRASDGRQARHRLRPGKDVIVLAVSRLASPPASRMPETAADAGFSHWPQHDVGLLSQPHRAAMPLSKHLATPP